MRVEIVSIEVPRKPSLLASVKIRLHFEGGHILDIADIRVILNKRNEKWISMPTFSVQDGKNYRYEKTCEASRGLTRLIDDAVLASYDKWDTERNRRNAVQS